VGHFGTFGAILGQYKKKCIIFGNVAIYPFCPNFANRKLLYFGMIQVN
jgi:hypothetical protein